MQQPVNARSRQIGRHAAPLSVPGLLMPILALLLMLWLQVPASAEFRYSISEKDSLVILNADGSADVTERIAFTLKGSVNNLVMEIVKPADSGIVLEKVASYGLGRLVSCRPLESGQWGGSVFSGMYSVFDESGRFRIKAYYPKGLDHTVYYLQYRIMQAVSRYPDMADFVFRPVSGEWPTEVSHVKVRVVMPGEDGNRDAELYFRGVPSGTAVKTGNRMLDFNLPGTVPGEEPAVRVMFPPEQVSGAPILSPARQWDLLRAEETRMREEAAVISRNAREKAAATEKKRISAIEAQKRFSEPAAAVSVILAAAGMVSAMSYASANARTGLPAMVLYIARVAAFDGKSGYAIKAGMLMSASGLVIGVALVIWQGYLLLVPGLLLVALGNKAEANLKGTKCLKSA
jgi:hypothetical protein